MTTWEENNGVHSARIDGVDYAVEEFGRVRGRGLWQVLRNDGSGWSRVSTFQNSAAEARADAEDFAAHLAEAAAKGRRTRWLKSPGVATPWGAATRAVDYGLGVIAYYAGGCGGFQVAPARNAAVPDPLRIADGWYDEAQRARVVLSFPGMFTGRELRDAERDLRDRSPQTWEALHGRALAEGESKAKDERLFLERHKDQWLGVSARKSGLDGMVVVTAFLGGDPGSGCMAEYLVPADEHGNARFGVVIDPARHQRI